MDFTLIPNWRNKNLRCHFCSITESVKYETEIFDPVVSTKPTKVCVCNKCALHYLLNKVTDINNYCEGYK